MARLDVKDKDPFANTDAEPKDNVSASGFFARLILRFGLYRLFWFLISGAIIMNFDLSVAIIGLNYRNRRKLE